MPSPTSRLDRNSFQRVLLNFYRKMQGFEKQNKRTQAKFEKKPFKSEAILFIAEAEY